MAVKVPAAARSAPAVAAWVGAAWGLAGYAVLWGHIPVVATRRFVVSAAGTIALLPVRVVLWGIRQAEGVAGHPFDFSQTNGWIGALAGLVGAAVGVVGFLLVRAAIRALPARRGRSRG